MYKRVNTCALSNSAAFQANSTSFKEAVEFLAASDNRLGDFHKYTKEELYALVKLHSKFHPDLFQDHVISVLQESHPSVMMALFCTDVESSENLIARECLNELVFAYMKEEIWVIENNYIDEMARCRGFDYRYSKVMEDEYDCCACDAAAAINSELRRAA